MAQENIKIKKQSLLPPQLTQLSQFSDQSSHNLEQQYTLSNQFDGNSKSREDSYLQYQIKINAPIEEQKYYQQQIITEYPEQKIKKSGLEENFDSINQQSQKNENITGYQSLKDCFSQEQILDAFRAIDLNKDNFISQQDMILFLDNLNEPYTKQELRQMITMFDNENKNKVSFDDFKKLAEGEIIGLGNYFIPDHKGKENTKILENILKTDLINVLNPDNSQLLINSIKNESIDIEKFKQNLDKKQQIISPYIEASKKKNFSIEGFNRPKYSVQQHKLRKNLFQKIIKIDVQSLIQNYNGLDNKMINSKQMARMFEIEQKQVKKLYKQDKVLSKLAVIQFISYSINLDKLQKIQRCLSIVNKTNKIDYQQIIKLFQIMQAYDSKLDSKLKTIFRKKQIDFNQSIEKELLMQIMMDYHTIFFF